MNEALSDRERQAMIANDVRVLVSELNEKIKQASKQGLRVEVDDNYRLEFKAGVCGYPVISVRVLAEVV
jgi:hypothetical protein